MILDSPVGDGGDGHEGQIHSSQIEEGSQLQADGRRRVRERTQPTKDYSDHPGPIQLVST